MNVQTPIQMAYLNLLCYMRRIYYLYNLTKIVPRLLELISFLDNQMVQHKISSKFYGTMLKVYKSVETGENKFGNGYGERNCVDDNFFICDKVLL